MSVRDTLDKLENIAVGASRVPLTGRVIINDNDLIHYVAELRQDLPKELGRADEIMSHHDEIINNAEAEAAEIRKRAEEYAEGVANESEIVKQAQEKAKTILEQAQNQAREIMERTQRNATQLQNDADNYANQVFDQLIAHVSGTFQGVRQTETGLEQALNVLQQAKAQMSRQQSATVATGMADDTAESK